MEALSYRLERFEGPLDLLLSLIAKNKVNIEDIPISLICGQYLDYLREAEKMDMDIASEFIVMASELMLIKSKMLLSKPEETEEDPRRVLADAIIRYQRAKAAAVKLAERYALYSERMVKDTDEISIDKTFVADQDPEALHLAIRRVKSYMEALEDARSRAFTPMISKKIVSVEMKISRILRHMDISRRATLGELLREEESVPDTIAAFIGVLELVRIRRLLIDENSDYYDPEALHGLDTRLILNTDESTVLHEDNPSYAVGKF